MVCKEEKLISQFLSGREEAFTEIIEYYKAYIFAIILKFVNNPNDAQDIAQEVFLQIYQSLPRYQSKNFKAWIGTISTHKAIDWKRANAKLKSTASIDDINSIQDESGKNEPDTIFLQEEYREKVREVCQKLPDTYGRVIADFYFESKTYQDIAATEGISLKTVESRLYRARNMFREKWKEEAGG